MNLSSHQYYDLISDTIESKMKNGELKEALQAFLIDHKIGLCESTAGKNHHNYPGGLIEHSYNVLSMSLLISEKYQNGYLDLDLVIAASILHDVGKIKTSMSKKTEDLLPHPLMSVLMVKNYLDMYDIPETYKNEIFNCITTHSLNEKDDLPLGCMHMLEAYIVHQADGIDAYLPNGLSALSKIDPGGHTNDAKFPNTLYKSDNL